MAALLLNALLCGGAVPYDGDDGWTQFKTKDGGVACAFPAALKKLDERGDKKAVTRKFSCKTDKGAYEFNVTESKAGAPINKKEMLDACIRAVDGMKNNGYEAIEEGAVEPSDFAVYEALLRLEGKNQYVRLRMAYSDTKAIQLKATGGRDFVKSDDVLRVMKSLKVTK